MKTLYKCWISLKNTFKVASRRPAPIVNKTTSKTGKNAYNIYKLKGAPVAIIIKTRIIIEKPNVTKLDRTLLRLYIYFGM